MPIKLVTGLPGHGKTLWTLAQVKEQAEREKRVVWYHGIDDLRVPWVAMEEPQEWLKAPAGAIIVLDEAQRLYRMRAPSSAVPDYVSALETHRHNGLDLYIITQHPMLLDTALRRMVDQHFHIVRQFGTQRATVHQFEGLNSEPDKGREGSMRSEFVYPKEVYELYHSAEVHTVKRRIPGRVYFLLAVPVLVGLLGWAAWSVMSKYTSAEGTAARITGQGASAVGLPPGGGPGKGVFPVTPAEYMKARTPLIASLPWTAPVYAEVTQVTRAPYPAACIASESSGCRCWTQDATPLEVDRGVCLQVVKGGFFQDWRADPAAGGARDGPGRPADGTAPSTARAAPSSPSVRAASS